MQNNSQKTFPPIIDLGDFILREKQESDINDFFEYYSNPRVNQFIMSQIPQNINEARHELLYWRNIFYRGDGIYFAIADKISDKLIGTIGLTSHNTYNSRIEISYDLGVDYWGKGIMTKAIRAANKYAFENMSLNRIEASVAVDNVASKFLLQKCGFTLEGILRQHRYHHGRYLDVYFFSLLRRDFLEV